MSNYGSEITRCVGVEIRWLDITKIVHSNASFFEEEQYGLKFTASAYRYSLVSSCCQFFHGNFQRLLLCWWLIIWPHGYQPLEEFLTHLFSVYDIKNSEWKNIDLTNYILHRQTFIREECTLCKLIKGVMNFISNTVSNICNTNTRYCLCCIVFWWRETFRCSCYTVWEIRKATLEASWEKIMLAWILSGLWNSLQMWTDILAKQFVQEDCWSLRGVFA